MLSRICFVFSLLIALSAQAQDRLPPDLAAIVGTYKGEAANGGVLVPVTTTFRIASGGRLTGSYFVDDARGNFEGTISNAFFEDGTLRLEWTDRDGEGYAEFNFSPDFRRFDGFWTSYDSQTEAPWTGVKQ